MAKRPSRKRAASADAKPNAKAADPGIFRPGPPLVRAAPVAPIAKLPVRKTPRSGVAAQSPATDDLFRPGPPKRNQQTLMVRWARGMGFVPDGPERRTPEGCVIQYWRCVWGCESTDYNHTAGRGLHRSSCGYWEHEQAELAKV